MAVKDAFLAGILAHVPEADRGKAETALEALEKDGLRQEDYSKLADQAQTSKQKFDELYTKNTEWYEARKADLSELDTLRAQIKTKPEGGGEKKTDLPADVITKKELESILDVTERGAVGFIAEANALTLKHYKEFGDILDIHDLLADKRVQQIGLKGVYADKFKDQLKSKADAAQAARDETLRQEGAKAERERLASQQMSYPVVGNEPSALDAIEATRAGKEPAVKSVADMASEYARLNEKRVGAA